MIIIILPSVIFFSLYIFTVWLWRPRFSFSKSRYFFHSYLILSFMSPFPVALWHLKMLQVWYFLYVNGILWANYWPTLYSGLESETKTKKVSQWTGIIYLYEKSKNNSRVLSIPWQGSQILLLEEFYLYQWLNMYESKKLSSCLRWVP